MEEAKTSILADLDNTIEEINRLNQDCVANYATITKDIELIQQWMGQLQGAESELEQDIERCKANGQEITPEVNAKI
jgi:phage gp45-like